jgi:hypothetical protein
MSLENENGHLVLKAFDKYYESLINIGSRREVWGNEIENLLITTLKSVKAEIKIGLQIQNVKQVNNYSSIIFCLNNTPSGLFKPLGASSVENYIKIGGALVFAQSYNGKINIIVRFPYIENFLSEMDVKVIKTISPELITENLIKEMVAEFFDYMTLWEDENLHSARIGY